MSDSEVLLFTQDLIRIPSVTPLDLGALDFLQEKLVSLGFECRRYRFEDVENLYAKIGNSKPNFCFAGHTDVVPVGDLAKWKFPPFAAEIDGEYLYGRGSADMKSAIAAFVFAAESFLKSNKNFGTISLMITGDEEGAAINGTRKLLPKIIEEGEVLDFCLVGEPTCPEFLGEMIKNGRRGSVNVHVISQGVQGHVGYPDKAINPIPALLDFLQNANGRVLDNGADGFQASNLEIVTIDVGNKASNVIPEKAEARFNIRFNTNHTGESLSNWLENLRDEINSRHKATITLDIAISGEAFFTEPCELTEIVQNAAKQITGHTPILSTSGGTSDARFIRSHCKVCEFGLVGATIHKVDEHIRVSDIANLRDIYGLILENYFAVKSHGR